MNTEQVRSITGLSSAWSLPSLWVVEGPSLQLAFADKATAEEFCKANDPEKTVFSIKPLPYFPAYFNGFLWSDSKCISAGCVNPATHKGIMLCDNCYRLRRADGKNPEKRSDGWRLRETRRKSNGKPKNKYKMAQKQALIRKIDFTLTLEEFIEKTSLPCDYCGGALPVTGAGLDRKNNALGYTTENTVPCCSFCNRRKNSTHTYETFKKITAEEKERGSKEFRGGGLNGIPVSPSVPVQNGLLQGTSLSGGTHS